MDLARDILLAVERHDNFVVNMEDVDLGRPIDSNTFVGHVRLLVDAGYFMPLAEQRIKGYVSRGGLEISAAGHDFLDSTRDPEIWKKTKAGAKSVGSWTFKMLGEIAVGYAKAKAVQFGIPLG